MSNKLFSFYGATYDIYLENVSQNLTPPCFLINLISSDIKMYFKPRYRFYSNFDVIYFSNDVKQYDDCLARSSELFDLLEYITLSDDSLIRGSKMSTYIQDDILHFNVSYNLILQNKSDIINMMEEQKNNIGVINRWV